MSTMKTKKVVEEQKEYEVKVLVSTILIVKVTATNEEEALGLAEDQAMADINVGDLMYEAVEDSVKLYDEDEDSVITI